MGAPKNLHGQRRKIVLNNLFCEEAGFCEFRGTPNVPVDISLGAVFVIGDGIQDQYLVASQETFSEESPGSKFIGITSLIGGGALNVAANIQGCGAHTFSLCPTTDTKYRVVDAGGNTVLRFDCPYQHVLVGLEHQLSAYLLDCRVWFKTLVISDYAKGTLTSSVIEALAAGGWGQVFIDTKQSPEVFKALAERFGNSCTFLPNRQEYGVYKPLYDLLPSVVRTESEDGVSMLAYGHEMVHLPSVAKQVVSVCGAGDTVTATVAVGRHRGLTWKKSLEFAMKCAAQVVADPMTATPAGARILLENYCAINI